MQAQQNRQRKIVSLCGSEAGKSLGIFAFSAAVNLILLVLLSSGRPFVYSMADDMLLRNMLSGSLYDAGYNILFKSWLSQLISWLYRNTSLTIWYALLVIGGNAAASTVILYAAMKLATGWKRKGISALFFLFFYIGYCYRFLYPTYTETACLLLLAATLVFIVGITKDGKS